MHVIWDFDGTLYNSYPQMTKAMLNALDDLGAHPAPQDVYRLLKVSVFHCCVMMAEQYACSPKVIQAAFAKRHAKETSFPPYPGARENLQAVRTLGGQNYLYTHRDRLALDCLRHDGMDALFAGAITKEDGFPDKPAPDAIRHLLCKHGVAPRLALMVGDRDIDLQAAENAGVDAVLFDPNGFYPTTLAAYRVASHNELTRILMRLSYGEKKGNVPL